MEITTFRAASLQEALDHVRKSLGPDASVLNTREVRRTRFGLFPQSMIEVEASAETPIESKEVLSTTTPRIDPQRIDPNHFSDQRLGDASQIQSIVDRVRASGSIEIKEGRRTIASFVGPTGAGKTTSLAKIAAGFRFDFGCKIGLITLDTFRLGGVDQLLQYAELVAAPLEVVSSPEQVTPALARLEECDLVLLDTAGLSPRDLGQMQLLRSFLKAAQPDSTYLVVSACSSRNQVADTIEKFSIVDPTNLLVTKLDEAVDFAAWRPLLFDTELPVSYMTTGQHVPQDIVVANRNVSPKSFVVAITSTLRQRRIRLVNRSKRATKLSRNSQLARFGGFGVIDKLAPTRDNMSHVIHCR